MASSRPTASAPGTPPGQARGAGWAMATRGVLNLEFYRGDTFAQPLDFSSGGAPLDVSAGTWSAQVRPSPDGTADVVDLEVDTTEAATGRLWLRLGAADAALLRRNGVWDLQQDIAGTIRTWLAGTATVVKDVTRP